MSDVRTRFKTYKLLKDLAIGGAVALPGILYVIVGITEEWFKVPVCVPKTVQGVRYSCLDMQHVFNFTSGVLLAVTGIIVTVVFWAGVALLVNVLRECFDRYVDVEVLDDE